MFSFRDFILMAAGFEIAHTLAHVMIWCRSLLPMDFGFMVLTPEVNLGAILVNGAIALGLLWYARNK